MLISNKLDGNNVELYCNININNLLTVSIVILEKSCNNSNFVSWYVYSKSVDRLMNLPVKQQYLGMYNLWKW